MKGFLKILLPTVLLLVLLCALCVEVGAVDISDNAARVPVLSYGLRVLASQTDMRVSGISGQTYNFSEHVFLCSMNVSDVQSIQITRLPDAVQGTLYCGAETARVGQTISGDSIDKMTFTPSKSFAECATFGFRINGGEYETECKIYMLSAVNSAPTPSTASYASLNIRTHRDIGTSGVLSGYDPEGDDMTFEIVKYPKQGVIKMVDKSYGVYTYIPCDGFSGKDSFEYVVRDEYGNYSASETVNITVSVPSVSVTYSDLEGSDIHTYAIALTEQGIMNGTQVGEYFYFRPDTEVSRAELVVTVMSALGIKDVPDVEDTGFFDDEDIRPEMKGYISLAYAKGYISGIKRDGEIYFCPDETVKLSEAAVIISNIIGYSEPEIKPVFSDSASIPAWSERAVVSLHALGVIESADGSIEATQTVTRGAMARIVSKAMQITGN